VKICLCTSNLERRERNSRDMDFTCSRTRCLDHISGQDSLPKKWNLYTLSNASVFVQLNAQLDCSRSVKTYLKIYINMFLHVSV